MGIAIAHWRTSSCLTVTDPRSTATPSASLSQHPRGMSECQCDAKRGSWWRGAGQDLMQAREVRFCRKPLKVVVQVLHAPIIEAGIIFVSVSLHIRQGSGTCFARLWHE